MTVIFSDRDKLKAVEREIAMRKTFYPQRVALGRMTEEAAARELAIMNSIADDYRHRLRSAD
jgi:hypothetical protein